MYPSPRATAIASPSSRYLPTTGRDRHSNTPVLSLIDTPSRTNSSSESYADRGGDPSTTPAWTVGSPASLHPNFGNKSVFNLECAHCAQTVCRRGMKASLLADTQVELFSTDIIPESRVELVAENYNTHNCNCRIRDFACLGCGNVVGYHITQPCESCMSSCNNGHFWMFHSGAVNPVVRAKPAGNRLCFES
ncbi:FAM72 protein-domain-containing protein [Cladochytrium replicatum]|nr:FAM72 protein-domain-containing protein [Cladochytrium replicatum]